MPLVALGLLAGAGIGFLGLIILICWVLGLIDVIRSRELDRQKRLAWILIIVLLPIIGTIGYFVSRPAPPGAGARRSTRRRAAGASTSAPGRTGAVRYSSWGAPSGRAGSRRVNQSERKAKIATAPTARFRPWSSASP